MRAVIFANGELGDVRQARQLAGAADLVVAADGGARNALAAGVVPHLVIGDHDSLSEADRARAQAAGTDLIKHPERKDETDLELALLHAARVGATDISVLAALGGRLDQTVANLMLLARPELRSLDVRIVHGNQVARLLTPGAGGLTVKGEPGDTLSLIPVGGDVTGVTASGVQWELDGETLQFGPARGVSNVLVEREVEIQLDGGQLLCVVTHHGGAGAAGSGGEL